MALYQIDFKFITWHELAEAKNRTEAALKAFNSKFCIVNVFTDSP